MKKRKQKLNKNRFLDDFEGHEKQIKLNEGQLKPIILEIRLVSYKSSVIQERQLNSLLEDKGTADGSNYPSKHITKLQEFFKNNYFLLVDKSGNEKLQLIDSLKVIWFLIVFSKEEEDKKISAFIQAIWEEIRGNDFYDKVVSDNEYISDNAQGISFYRKNTKLLEVLAWLLAAAILPFVFYFENKINDKDFKSFIEYSTTNSNIFYDFARYISKNYLFYIDKSAPLFKNKQKDSKYTKSEFKKLWNENYSNIFDSKTIRKRFMEFVSKYQIKALTEAPINRNAIRISNKYSDNNTSNIEW